jgi:CDGSH-type Zn-finger protein
MARVYIQANENGSNRVWVDGQIVAKLCRCGHSATKPLCDGSHRAVGWVAPAAEIVILE